MAQSTIRYESLPTVLRPARAMFDCVPSVNFGPTMPDGRRQIAVGDAEYWIAKFTYDIFTRSQVLNYRAMKMRLSIGQGKVAVPVYDRRQAPWPTGYDYESNGATTNVGNASLSDGTQVVQRIINIRPNASYPAGTRTIQVKLINAGPLNAGMYFSMKEPVSGYDRLHMIINQPRIVSGQPTLRNIDVLPGLRFAITPTTQMDWDNPKCAMRLLGGDEGMLELEAWHSAYPRPFFREAFD